MTMSASYWWFIAGLFVGQLCGFITAMIGVRLGIKDWLDNDDARETSLCKN
jgi:hypothetical protein